MKELWQRHESDSEPLPARVPGEAAQQDRISAAGVVRLFCQRAGEVRRSERGDEAN